ncbi:aminoacyl-tRNA hydrolase [Virgibacillus sp. YIM 98842]|uniref:aminoacyl-tRNA hydrolase n=1 Tax=Virgibacillus sp. YIM 98842 TaxID=2663533 RepID=UPI0013DC74B3|nr:aminoacyl-tRNA hydrolase [Virgibacillus sp. YIM 98842]
MKCIVGLGNPGRKYKDTRHNVGFMVIEELRKRHKWKLNQSKFNGKYTMEILDGQKVILLQPQTYMNLSGEAIRPLMNYFDIDLDDLIVIYDDLDLPVGKIRLRQKGGHGGHNGIRSTIDHLGTKEFKRIRIGVGRPVDQMPVINYVLGKFPKEEQDSVSSSINLAADACEAWITKPYSEVMNEYNR